MASIVSTTKTTTTKKKMPRMIVFDLDGCLWKPELYQLKKRLTDGVDNQSPFVLLPGGTRCRSQLGSVVSLFPDVPEILDHLVVVKLQQEEDQDDEGKNNGKCNEKSTTATGMLQLAISSRTDQPEWARELLERMTLPRSGWTLAQAIGGPWEMASQDAKVLHFERLSRQTGIAPEDMVFFDDVTGNCRAVSRLGVTVGHTPKGLTRDVFDKTMAKFPTKWGVVGLEI